MGAITGYNILEPNSLEAVMDFIANQGPLAVAAYASPWGRYSHGVFDGCPYDGYIALKRESTSVCGINSSPMDGTACVGGPGNDQQTVCGMCGILFDTSYPLGPHMIDA